MENPDTSRETVEHQSKYFYGIANGRTIGVFKAASVKEYNEHIRVVTNGFADSRHKRFNTLRQALLYMKDNGYVTSILYDHMFNKLDIYALKARSEPVRLLRNCASGNDENCKTCSDPVGQDDYHPQCEACEKWFHLSCINMAKESLPKNEYVCDSCLGNLQEEVQTSGTEEVEDGAARVSQDHARGVPDEDNTTVLEDSSSQQVLNLLLERMDKLEIENSQLKNRIYDLEKKLQSSTDSGPPRCPDTIVKGLQVVTAAKEVI